MFEDVSSEQFDKETDREQRPNELVKELAGPIVVFGAGGFIGCNLFREVLKTRNDVYAITHQPFVPWRLIGVPAQNIIRCDINDSDTVMRLFRAYRFETIFFLAAYGAYSKQSDAKLIYETNVVGLLNVLNAAAEEGFQAFVHAGSSSEYGTNCAGPAEDSTTVPNSHYSVSKISASYLLTYLGQTKNLPVINLRYYSAYGPWEEPDRLVPMLLNKGREGGYPPLVNPEISRDFVYISDIVDATLRAAIKGVKLVQGGSLNIASGTKTSLREIAEVSRGIFNLNTEPQWGTMPNRGWDLSDWYGNPDRAKQVLDWQATTSLEDGLRKTLEWLESQRDIPAVSQQVDILNPVRISAVIACYKDAQAIPIMHERLVNSFRSINVDYEIIFVNDGSPDNSDEVLAALTHDDHHVVAIEHSRNFGSQSAFLSGMQIATGHAVVLLDGDLQDPPELIPSFYKKWVEGYEVVYGRRVQREASWFMQFAYKGFYRIFRNMAYIPIPVDAGDFSLMDRKVVDELLALPERDQFLRGLRAWVGFKQTGVDYVRPERQFGRSTNNMRKNFWWARKGIFSFSYAPLEILMYFGLGTTAIAVLGLIFSIIMRFVDPTVPRGATTIIVLIFLFGGLQMLALSIIGEYLSKVLDETKGRPNYILKSIRYAGEHLTAAPLLRKFKQERLYYRETAS